MYTNRPQNDHRFSFGKGHRFVFSSPYAAHVDRIGQAAVVIAKVRPSTYDAHEVGAMFRVRFEDGTVIEAWPEEIDAALHDA